MSEEELKILLKAGQISKKAREEGARLIKSGAKLIDICNKVEEIIIQNGAKPAFPCNISLNHEAAHYSPVIDDTKEIPEGAIIKLDIGAQIDGYITDTAITVALDDRYSRLVEASKEALASAIANMKAGITLGEIGRIIEKVIKMYGFKPIRNLGGHLIRRYELHAGVFVPNIGDRNPFKLQEGQVYAIEPFATDGLGEVVEGKEVTIYSLKKYTEKGLNQKEILVLKEINKRFNSLPFSERWLKDLMNASELREILKNLSKKGILREYPILIEVKKGMVSQFEHTVYIAKNEALLVTD